MLQKLPLPSKQTSAAGAPWGWFDSLWLAAVVGAAYILAAKLSLALLTAGGVAVFWPAAGVASGVLIAFGPSARLAVVVGTMVATVVANLLGDRNLWSALVFAVCNAGEAVLTAGLIAWYFGPHFKLDRLRQVLGLLAAAIVGTAVSGVGGTLGFALFHGATDPIAIWKNWFAADGLGIVAIAPLVIGLAAATREPPLRRETTEGLVALALLVLASAVVISLPPEPWQTVVPIALLFPILLWIAARCRPLFAAAAVFIVTIAIVWTTTIGLGYFGDPNQPMGDRVVAAQAGILIVALCAYVLAALFAERRQHEAALVESEWRLQEALTAGAVTTFVWDVRSGASQRSANAAQVLGFPPRQASAAKDFLARVHPDDQARFKALALGVSPEQPTYTATFRFRHPDGRVVWLEEVATAEFDPLGRLVRSKGLTVDVTARKRSEDQQKLLIAGLDHDVKHLLARVAGLVDDMRRGSGTLDEYIAALQGRIRSMAEAHALLSENRTQGVSLADLVRRQLAPYATDANTIIDGPDVTIPVGAIQALAMTLHELATNAADYGALSTPHGRLEVSWHREPNGAAAKPAAPASSPPAASPASSPPAASPASSPLAAPSASSPAAPTNPESTPKAAIPSISMQWREIGGPAVAAVPERGYGVELIRTLIPRELGSAVDLVFAPGGVHCRIEIPLAPTP